MVRHENVTTLVHAHTSWVPDLSVTLSPTSKLVQKPTIGIKYLRKSKKMSVNLYKKSRVRCTNTGEKKETKTKTKKKMAS